MPRLAPLEEPYEPEVARTLERLMPPGVPPLALFRTIAHHPHVLERFRSIGTYLLNFGTLEPLDREIVIHRTSAVCGCEYEWGVHAVVFGRPLGLSDAELAATVNGDRSALSERHALLVRLVDELHETATVSDALWAELAARYRPDQLVELIVLVGQYHLVAFLANAFEIELEPHAARW